MKFEWSVQYGTNTELGGVPSLIQLISPLPLSDSTEESTVARMQSKKFLYEREQIAISLFHYESGE